MAGSMQFWGVEIKAKQAHKENLLSGTIIHVSQVTLGDAKKDKEPVTVHVKVGNTKLVMGFLSQEAPQLACDLVFDDDVEFSHNWKNGSIHLMGYKAETGEPPIDFGSSDEEEEEDVPVAKENGQISAAVAKPKVEDKPKPELKDAVDEDDSSEDGDFEEGDSDDDMGSSDSDDEDDDDESEDSEEEKPVVAAATPSKKRANPAAKTPEPKKAKIVATPSKTDSKKGAAHPDTPHPKKEEKTAGGSKSESKGKKGGNTPAAEKSPKSAGDVACGSCKKTFKSDVALQSHTKAKHSTEAK